MKKDLDKIFELSKDMEHRTFTLLCTINSFKHLQKLMSEEYHIQEPDDGMWRHVVESDKSGYREGTFNFNNCQINVFCTKRISGEFVFFEDGMIPLINTKVFKHYKEQDGVAVS